MTIRGNIFSEACLTSEYEGGDAVISVHPNLTRPLRKAPYHRGLRVENNVFYTAGDPILYAKAASGITFCGNRILFSRRYPPRKSGNTLFAFDHCTDVTLEGNEISLAGGSISLTGMMEQDIHQTDALPLEMENKEKKI